MRGEYVEDARRTGRSPNFSIQLRVQSALEGMPLPFVRCIIEATYAPATAVSHILTKVLGLRFSH
jgi:hypothetical protein